MFAYNFGEAFGEFAIIAWIFVIFGFILTFVLGFVCMSIMKKKGYDMPAAWFCCGMMNPPDAKTCIQCGKRLF